MNDLVKALVEGIINEEEFSDKKIIGMFGGGFKPPTAGHLEVVKRALQENPEMDALIVLVGSGTRNSISQEESLAIWDIYKKSLPSKVQIMASPKNKPPIGAIYSYAKKNPNKEIYWFIGAREGNEEDFQDIEKRTRSLRKLAYQNVKVKEIITSGAVSGTKARQALLKGDKETFTQFIPDIPEVDEIWDMLTNVITERINFTPDFITKGDVEFVDDMADKKLAPIEIDLSGNHFFDRINDPRNYPDISIEELEDFFDKLSDEKEEFIEFLQKYREIVVKDTETNINIPFMKLANKAIAKTIMRKKNFLSSTPVLPLQEISYDGETTIQSRYIINQLKASLGTYYEEETVGNLNGIEYTLEFKLNPVKSKDLGSTPYLLDAAGGKNSIELVINYIPSSLPQSFNDLIAELKDTLRHELEHVGQENFEKGVKINPSKNDTDLSLPEYLTLDYEIPAFIKGLIKKAKTKKITLGQAIDEFFLERAEEISYEEEAYVKRKWAEWVKKNLPKTPLQEADPKKGTGKKPKGSSRRLYTDEDPSDTVGIKFKTKEDIVDTLNKSSFKKKPHARQSQVINLIHQRVRAAYGKAKDPDVKSRLKRGLDYITKRKEASKKKTQRLKDKKTNENVVINHNQKSSPYGSGYEKLNENFEGRIQSYTDSLSKYMANQNLNIQPLPSLEFIDNDEDNASNIFGRTAYYMPSEMKIVLYTMGRHPKDILRSFAHEMIHHHQNLSGTLGDIQTTNTNEDGNLEKLEREAYENGNIMFRNWEDSIKNEN
jgi:cytidyltransferase-like protein